LAIGKYEHRTAPVLSHRAFVSRLWSHFLTALGVVLVSLAAGILGYHALAHFSWIDSFLNAAMLLGGMGPVGEIPSASGKIFAALYALYSGLVLIAVAGILLAPIIHRVMHRFHVEARG
jgi:hypothetical protein